MVSPKLFVGAALLAAYSGLVGALPQPGNGGQSGNNGGGGGGGGGGGQSFWEPIYNVTVFSAPPWYNTPRTLYARSALIPGTNDLLMTWENYSPQPPLVYFPIFKSIDGAKHWFEISKVTDQVNGWGLRYQPFLYFLPKQIGRFPQGTLLCAGNSIPEDLSATRIDLYASFDQGYTWEFVSHIAEGGEAVPDNGLTPIWEPFLMVYQDMLVVYYSDQRDPLHGQKLVHQTSTDLLHWGPVVNDVAYPTYDQRPGMTTVTYLPPSGEYMMTYEYGGGPNADNSTTYEFPVYYRKNRNPLDFNNSTGYPLISSDGTQPDGSPYITWSPYGGVDGTILVSSGCCSEVFENKALGAVDAWTSMVTGAEISYTRSLRVLPDVSKLLIAGGGQLSVNNTAVKVDIRQIQ